MTAPGLHTRIANFVAWIRPDQANDKLEEARKQRDEVRDRIKGRALADDLTVRATPGAGSFATSTGLRRHMRGDSEHEGQDIDCPFVVSPRTKEGEKLVELLNRFDGYARATYPDTPREKTDSSVKLSFVASRRNFDLVPMLAIPGTDEEQILLRADGEQRRTSIQKHVEFVKRRTKASQDVGGPVAFNDAVRLLKWWREYRLTQRSPITKVPSFLVLLLCAKAFDTVSVSTTWPQTLHRWFDLIQCWAAARADVTFADFTPARPHALTDRWKVIDPVNGANSVVPSSWSGIHIDEFRDWARSARDGVAQAIAHDMGGHGAKAVSSMSAVLGPAFAQHSEGS